MQWLWLSLSPSFCCRGSKMSPNKSLMLLCLTTAAFSSSWAAAPSAEDLISTSCGVALDVFSQCSSGAKGGKLDAACCTPYSVMKTFNCFWYVQINPKESGFAYWEFAGCTHSIAVANALLNCQRTCSTSTCLYWAKYACWLPPPLPSMRSCQQRLVALSSLWSDQYVLHLAATLR